MTRPATTGELEMIAKHELELAGGFRRIDPRQRGSLVSVGIQVREDGEDLIFTTYERIETPQEAGS